MKNPFKFHPNPGINASLREHLAKNPTGRFYKSQPAIQNIPITRTPMAASDLGPPREADRRQPGRTTAREVPGADPYRGCILMEPSPHPNPLWPK